MSEQCFYFKHSATELTVRFQVNIDYFYYYPFFLTLHVQYNEDSSINFHVKYVAKTDPTYTCSSFSLFIIFQIKCYNSVIQL